jgi:hypothetical protein
MDTDVYTVYKTKIVNYKRMEITSETFVQRIAYSYIRFSSSAQSEGDSFRRQIEKTVKFCEENNLHLSDTRYEDLGVSGYTGENIETGALARFIEAVTGHKCGWNRMRKCLRQWTSWNKIKRAKEESPETRLWRQGISRGIFYITDCNPRSHRKTVSPRMLDDLLFKAD